MITSDDNPPPDPSSSDYQNQQLVKDFKINNGEKAFASVSNIDLLKSLIAYLDDTNNPLPSFSIRDYVFSSRSKEIASNWPFSGKSLQICLQNGVKNLLPPFQSLESLRNRRSDKEVLNSSNGNPVDDQSVSSKSLNTKSKKTLPVSSQTAIKKCKKVNPSVEPVEDVIVMSSKVCPVCKTFSSSSNTTLNAHIDQCLSGESSMKWVANPKVMVKHRLKPRKTRLMVDVYRTAPHCTVEELDARNGTSWANGSSFHDQELEFHGEEEKETAIVTPEVADREGAVYIDDTGTKVRILSVPKLDESVDLGAQKLLRKKKRKDLERKHQKKHLKVSPNKDLGAPEVIKESFVKEDQGKESEVCTKMDDSPIVRPPWACSKRTVLARKFNPERKFSPLKRWKEETVTGPPQDSSKQRSRVEEEATAKAFEVGKNESRHENLEPSRSSNGDSSMRIETELMDELLDVEDLGKKTISDNMFTHDDKDMFCSDFIKESMHDNGVKIDHIESRQIYFSGVDPIQIPGPPGSFLPSPGGETASDQELQESMSDSPISTISDQELQDSRSSDKFSLNEKYASGFKTEQPCCCSRKESTSLQTLASSHRESTLLTKLALEPLNVISGMFLEAPETVIPAMNPSKPVLRLMGKNLTVEKIDEDGSSMGQFPDHHHFFNQNQYGLPSNSRTHAGSRPVQTLDTVFTLKDSSKPMKEIIVIDDNHEDEEENPFVHMRRNWEPLSLSNPVVNHMHYGYQSQGSSMAFGNGGFQDSFPFRDLSRMYHPPRFS